ncbi:MAG: hypothetical protein ACREBR_00565, partial [bacterium]
MNKRLSDTMPVHHYLVPILLFDDATLCDGLGRLATQAVLASFGNCNGTVRRTNNAWNLVSALAPYPKSQEERARDSTRVLTESDGLVFYHDMLRIVLRETLALCNNPDGVKMHVFGKGKVTLHFELCMIIGDTAGQDKMCGHYSAYSKPIQKMLRDCSIPTIHADDPHFRCIPTCLQDIKDAVEPALKEREANRGSMKKSTKERIKKVSQKPVRPVYWDFAFGGCERGVNGSTPFEILHVVYLGLFKYMLASLFNHVSVPGQLTKWYRDRMKGKTSGRMELRPSKIISSASAVCLFRKEEFERRVRLLTACASRQSDRDMPLLRGKNGVTPLTRLNGQEYPGLILVTMMCLERVFYVAGKSPEESAK